ncbi:MAG TPA: ATP-binding cassette domain-containing protein [Candidatus Babeliales bacterium]|nr:ATP-binding cassette domain-containing protein [Candidatus Babeliales bacterium]
MALIDIVDLYKRFGTKEVTRGVSLSIEESTSTVIIGRSGEGKSVLLKQIIGLLKPDSGHVYVEGIDITKLDEHALDQQLKKFGYVFQFAALLDSLNTFENIGISLLEKDVPEKEVLPRVKKMLKMVNLPEDSLYKYPAELSGGMRKRVGLARTLLTEPKIILFDEPTTGLDPITARIIHELIFSLKDALKVTIIIVSHDIEIFKYVDRVAILHEGQIKYICDAKTVWDSTNPYMYQFIRGLPEGPIITEVTNTSD